MIKVEKALGKWLCLSPVSAMISRLFHAQMLLKKSAEFMKKKIRLRILNQTQDG